MYDVLLGEVDPPIRKDVKLLSADPAALNPLQLAIVLDLPHVIRILLSSRRQISMEGEFGHTPLMLACELNRLECIEALLSLITKPKLDHREKVGGNSAFHFCCMNAINMNTSDNAIRSNAADALELLLSKTPFQLQKRALFSVNNKRQSLLHLACVSGDLRLVDCLLNELNSRGSSFVTKALNMRDAYHRVPFISAIKADE
jgi:ankyrin repeat protein